MTHQDPRWGAEDRDKKAKNIVECLSLLTDRNLSELDCVDIGCGSGGISFHLSPYFRTVRGVDPEPWERWQQLREAQPNLKFLSESVESLSLPDDSVDVVICNQVYEHVPSPEALISQIHRILKPGGICYFAGPNLLFPIEPHVFWPFVHWIPRSWALAVLRTFSPSRVDDMDAYSTTYWRLKRWLREFDAVDAVPPLVKHKAKNASAGLLWRVFRPVPIGVLKALAFLSPGFVFILTKPGEP